MSSQNIELQDLPPQPPQNTEAIDWAQVGIHEDTLVPETREDALETSRNWKGKKKVSARDWTRHTTSVSCRMTFLSESDLGDLWTLGSLHGEPLFGVNSARAVVQETNSRLARLVRPRVLDDHSRITHFAIHEVFAKSAKLSFYIEHPSGSFERTTKVVSWQSGYPDALKVSRAIQGESKTWTLPAEFTDHLSEDPLFPSQKARHISVDFAQPLWKVVSMDGAASGLSVYDLRIGQREIEVVSSDPLTTEGDLLLEYVLGPKQEGREVTSKEANTFSINVAREDDDWSLDRDASDDHAQKIADLETRGGCKDCYMQCETCCEERRAHVSTITADSHEAGRARSLWTRAYRPFKGKSRHDFAPDKPDAVITGVPEDQLPIRPQAAHLHDGLHTEAGF